MRVAPTNLRYIAAIAGLILILTSAGWYYVQRVRHMATEPSDISLAAAAEVIAKEIQAADAIAFNPGWSAAQRWRFALVWQKKGFDFNAAYMPAYPIELWDADGFSRLWVVSTHGYAAQLPALGKLLKRVEVGHGTDVQLIAIETSSVFDFRKQLALAKFEQEQPDHTFKLCPWRNDRHSCGGETWADVWQDFNEVGNSRHRCIYVQPHKDASIAKLTWPETPMADRLQGHFGNRLWAVRHDDGIDLTMKIKVGEKFLFEKKYPRADSTWLPFDVPLVASDRGKPISFEFSTPSIIWRQACFDARLTSAAAVATRAK